MTAHSAGLRVECRAPLTSAGACAVLFGLQLFGCSAETSHAMTEVGGASGVTAADGGGGGGRSIARAGRSGSPAAAGVGGSAPHDAGIDASSSDDRDSAAADADNTTWTSRPVAAAPSYMGSKDGSSGCTTSYATTGFEPVETSSMRHPLFLYFVGTRFVDSDQSARYDCQAAKKVTEAMARRGFVALSVDYDNSFSISLDKPTCLFGSSNPLNVLAVACKLPSVDCDRGIATWGHSQGALMAHLAADADARVRAVWTTGYGGNAAAKLRVNRLRVVNAQGDTMNSAHDTLVMAAGFSDAECPDDGRKQCLRADGSGFIIVQTAACQLTAGDHCWFDKLSCTAAGETLEPNWIDPKSTEPFALESNADWLVRTLQRP
jgi:hypothetical protein